MNTLFIVAFVGVASVCVNAQAQLWQQCGGVGFTGPTTCVAGASCTAQNDYYSQCVPGAAVPGTLTTPSTPTPTTIVTPSGTCLPNNPAANAGTTRFKGINIAGFDFGCDTTGACTESAAWPPLTEFYGADGAGQMTHFVQNDGMNVFRLPVGWQFLTGNQPTGTLKMENFEKYDKLVQACLSTGASCIIDVHNYARFNGKIIGQGGPSNDAFASLWASIATQYASNPRIIFGVMNEPHDVPDINAWAQSVQAAVAAIRNAGATTQLILLPGNNWTSAETFVSNGSADALAKVKNPDGSVAGLIFDVHKYADSDNSGTHSECTTNNISNAFAPLAQWLRCNNRQAFNTEMGGGNTASCVQMICEQVKFQNENSDVIIGYVGWAAGNFDKSYVLGETPTQSSGTWTDTLLVSSCLASK